MLALSTSYFTLRDIDLPGDELALRVLDLGFGALELDYRLTAAQLRQLEPRLASGELTVLSVHHPFPRPRAVSPFAAHLETARLSSLDRDERRAAVGLGGETLARAADVGAGAVVVHLGEVDVSPETDARGLERLCREGRRETEEYEILRDLVAAERGRGAPPHLDAVLWSLDRLAEEALRRGVSLGLENRCRPEQIPSLEELERIFAELGGAPVGYWHDTGHAESLAVQGFLSSPTDLPTALQGRLLGMHLHDADGLDDHRAPGEGKVNFGALAALCGPQTRLVLEVHPPAAPEALLAARSLLAGEGFAV